MPDPAAIRSHIDRFEAGASVPAERIKGLPPQHFDAVPIPGKWSIRQLILHLYESDLVACDRMRRIAAMKRPLLIGYDEAAFIANLHPEAVDVALAAEGFAINRRLLVPVLRALPTEAFARDGVHNERGLLTLEQMVKGYGDHLDHHLKFLDEKIAALRAR